MPRPEHPRPDLCRESWQPLNGEWQFEIDKDADGEARGLTHGKDLNSKIVVPFCPESKLWAPGTPNLYDLKLTLSSGKEKLDELGSYFGLRSVTIDGRRILINGKPVFQRLILDQGFYPEGLWTAPTDEALKKDIEMSLACGFNGARLHQKVFEPRFLYWADRLGYMVWGEYPDWGYEFHPESYAAVVNEWTEILLRDRNHPSIIGWCPFNEEDKRAKEISPMIWNVTKAVDPTRPALETSGWTHTLPNPEVLDSHDYEGSPGVLRNRWMDRLSVTQQDLPAPARYGNAPAPAPSRIIPYMVSEIGGVAWANEGGWGYGEQPKKLEEFYTRYQGTIDAMLDNPHLFGFTYTQLTDVEQERNGLYFYDITYYQLNSVTDALKKALKKGSNTIAVHTRQADGGQYIDLALLVEN